MTNAELIATIRKEIISRIDKRHLSEQAKNELVSLLSFLNTLESEKLMNLEEEISRTYHDGSVADTSDLDHNSYENIARHFAEWGAEHLKK